jgi:hypothetical protein
MSKRRFATAIAIALASAAVPAAAAAMPGQGPPTVGPVPAALDANVMLHAMPRGTIAVSRSRSGRLVLRLSAFGLTPGSTHALDLQHGACPRPFRLFGSGVATLPEVTADAQGRAQARVTVTTAAPTHAHGPLALSLRLGVPHTMDGGINRVAAETIACGRRPDKLRRQPVVLPLHGIETAGPANSRPAAVALLTGSARVTFDPMQRTLVVTVNARGFVPGSVHAAHLHAGSCKLQGKVLVMLPELVADDRGVIAATVTVPGVTALPASGLYLNIHEGDSASILSNGMPTLSFRPLLCGDVA